MLYEQPRCGNSVFTDQTPSGPPVPLHNVMEPPGVGPVDLADMIQDVLLLRGDVGRPNNTVDGLLEQWLACAPSPLVGVAPTQQLVAKLHVANWLVVHPAIFTVPEAIRKTRDRPIGHATPITRRS